MANPNWVKGMESPNPKGRPTKAREAAILAILSEIVGGQEWRNLFRQTMLDALGWRQVPGADGKVTLIKDEDSTASGRVSAMKTLLAYAVGMPTQYIKVNDDEGDAFEQFRNLSDEQINAILAELDRIQSASGIASSPSSGIGEATTDTDNPTP